MLSYESFQLGPFSLRVGHDHQVIQRCNIEAGAAPSDGAAKPPTRLQVNPQPTSELSTRIAAQLSAYLEHRCASFDLPLRPQGTAFQTRVWQRLLQIPAGEPLTYGQLARQLDTAAQPIGGACRANPIGFFIPCHRIVAAHTIGGYSGAWEQGPQLDIKRWLLRHEQGFMCHAG